MLPPREDRDRASTEDRVRTLELSVQDLRLQLDEVQVAHRRLGPDGEMDHEFRESRIGVFCGLCGAARYVHPARSAPSGARGRPRSA